MAGQVVDALLQPGVHLGHAKAAHGAADGVIGVNTVAIGLYVGHLIGSAAAITGSACHVHTIFGIGTPVPIERILHGQQLAILVTAHLEVANQSLANKGGIEFLLAGQAQLDWAALDLGGDGYCQGLHTHSGLGPKAASHVGGDDPHITLRDAQRLGDQITLGKGGLRAAPQRHLADFVHLGDGHVRLNRHVLHVGDAIFALDHGRAVPPGIKRVALADFEVVGEVGAWSGEDEGDDFVLAQVRVNQRRVGASAKFWVEDRLQLLVLHLDEIHGLLSYFFADGGHARDRVAHVAHPVTAENMAVSQIKADEAREILSGDDCLDAGQRPGLAGVNRLDYCVGIGAALDACV